jgi:hypothetical protein
VATILHITSFKSIQTMKTATKKNPIEHQVEQLHSKPFTPKVSIEETLNPSPEDITTMEDINKIANIMIDSVRGLFDLLLGPLHYSMKNSKEYGLYHTYNAGAIYVICKLLKITHVTDLGSGVMLWYKAIYKWSRGPGLKANGIENEPEIVRLGNAFLDMDEKDQIKLGNIMNLDPTWIKGNAVYMWDPLYNDDMRIELINSLYNVPHCRYIILMHGGIEHHISTMGDKYKRVLSLRGISAYERINYETQELNIPTA